ncbi:type II secretion system F family protein [Methylocapsa sp. S129]|uniref:type II secretion system F family protein n=1 Tax=Methylocapsa sp. S129 TaxID=1641869 RepID=UPI00131C4067|nr:type II secretion system F family protein [Methylocapsa sp. S129]
MLDLVIAKLSDGHFVAGILVALGCAASVLTLAMPLLQTDNLGRRMKAVSTEREKIRQRERERIAVNQNKAALRIAPKRLFKDVVDRLNLASWLGTERAKQQLAMAGYRGAGAEYTFLFFRLVTPITLFLAALLYMFVILQWDKPVLMKIGVAIGAMYLGIKAPEVFLSNTISKRKRSMERAYPNTLDLLLICVESGMSIEHAFRKVSMEVGAESIPMAEEMTLLAAEMSFLPDRRTAFENLGVRTGLESIRALVTVLVQAERYGTPLGAALRVLAQESRDARMTAAEKKAAALPPALTVPMILFFLPGLFAAILTPAIIQINHWT